ncbi:TPA: hypothetical protein ACS7W8_002494 [Providencia alcalifaciens]|uniref:hypothetical protein n=1 Tax=Providencia alcalifaciens TaxID=126385 RepID=UPI00044FE43C|nr:hypothetical protein [Providencia alcalifaciens]EUD06819.1 hypothetical protein HMPREF1564_2915 [Providencia alcalifaciens R90-1475]
MRQLFIFIVSLFPLSIYAETIFILKETQNVSIEEMSSQANKTLFRFTVDYINDNNTSGALRSSCWGSFDDMKNASNDGLYAAEITFNDGKLGVYASYTPMTFYSGNNTVNAYTNFRSLTGFNSDKWTLYCTAVSNMVTEIKFRPREVSYTIVNLMASSEAYPHISAPAIVDLKSCFPNQELETVIPLTVGFVGYIGQDKRMELTVKSNDLPDSFDITLDNQSILNKQPQVIQMPAGLKEKQIETRLKGLCPDNAGEYVWNAEYITTIQ